jgi:hypothetical protein
MDWSLPSALVDWAQVISAVLSLVALVLALFAIWKSKRDIALERRINHELEVLRDLGELVYEFGEFDERLGSSDIGRIRAALLMLPGSDDLPTLRVAVDARSSERARDDFSAKYSSWPGQPHSGYELERFQTVWRHGVVGPELEDAINRRLH